MEWRDDGLVIGARRHGETSVILELFTAAHGRHLGVVRGGRSRRLRAVLQPGNGVAATWRARLDEHIGAYAVEPVVMRAGRIMERARTLHALNHLCALARLLPERDPHPVLYRMLGDLLDAREGADHPSTAMVRFEMTLLSELGFGLDLERCAVTGARTDLAFVSPKTGRAVSRAAGEPYRDRILVLPAFLSAGAPDHDVPADDIAAAFRLTEHFLIRDIFAPRGLALPDARRSYLAALLDDDPTPPARTGRGAVRAQP